MSECFSKCYDAIVQAAIDYSASVWGTKSFSCINAVQFRACRYFLGVGKYTPTAAMVSHRGHNCISSALTILDSALTS